VNQQIYREASEWLVDLRVGDTDAAARERLDAWFRASPEHIRAFLELSSIWEDGADPDLDRAHTTHDLIARARAIATNVAEIGHSSRRVETPQAGAPVSRPRRALMPAGALARVIAPPRVRRFSVAASIALATLAAAALQLYRSLEGTYSTAVGEQRTVSLSDGSRIELNSRSEIRVEFSKSERHVELLAGQALFKVAKDPARPFVVGSDRARVRAVGTEFDVYREAAGTTVTVVAGRVAVMPTAESESMTRSEGSGAPESGATTERPVATVFVSAGEQVVVTPSKVTQPSNADVAAATAWTRHELVFESTPLAEVAQEFNRYNEKPLVVSDEALKNFHVTGIFSSTNPTSLLKFLGAQKDIEIVETDSAILITRK